MYQITRSSNSGSTKVVDKIYFEISSPKTLASYIRLREDLRMQDEDFLLVYGESLKRIQFSRDYLTKKKEECGSLTCTYCQAENLIIEYEGMRVPNKIKATIDHVLALSKGGDMYDLKNIVVACGKCNSKKSDKSVEDFLCIG